MAEYEKTPEAIKIAAKKVSLPMERGATRVLLATRYPKCPSARAPAACADTATGSFVLRRRAP